MDCQRHQNPKYTIFKVSVRVSVSDHGNLSKSDRLLENNVKKCNFHFNFNEVMLYLVPTQITVPI